MWGQITAVQSTYCTLILLNRMELTNVNWLWPGDTIWRHRAGSALAQVMACCLSAPCQYLNQCWFIINEVLCYSLCCQPKPSTNWNLLHWVCMWLCSFYVCDLLAMTLNNLPARDTGNSQVINSLNKFEKHISNICFHAFKCQLNQLTCISKHTHF